MTTTNDKMQQKVLCIKSDVLFENGKWNGLKTTNLDYYCQLLIDKSEFRIRGELENDPSYKNIIVQVVLRWGNKYFLHRQRNANEKRLNNLCPLPLGGHVEEFDVMGDRKNLLKTALGREIEEEAEICSNIINRTIVGFIYLEDGNLVNHVHVGIVYVFDLDGDKVKMHEGGLETIGWVDLEYLKSHKEELTYWSRIIIDEYLQKRDNQI